ncbi:MAG TPA: hypothetical protein VGN72_22425 [Tepidisphaeraceae bacterium]|nr:hypothetical protein [Tepidisphaeraceae bacterium]
MMGLINDWVYMLERTFPNLAGASTFLLGALLVIAVCAVMYLFTRQKVHLLTLGSAAIYMVPLMLKH